MKRNKKKIKGQASLEFMVLFPMFILLVLVLISLALQWHAFHVTVQGALESASGGLKKGAAAAYAEAPYADIEVHKTGDALPGKNVIESAFSKFIGFTSSGTAVQLISNPAKIDLGNPTTKGYVQAPGNWEFIPCDSACK